MPAQIPTQTYRDYTLRLAPSPGVSDPLKLLISIGGGGPSPFVIDTGSTGILAAPRWIGPRYIDTGLPFKLTYTSSGRSYSGTWVIATVTFHSSPVFGQPSIAPVSTVPMLIRRVEVQSEVTDATHGVAMMGVGFDRDTGPTSTGSQPTTGHLPVPSNINPFLMLPEMLFGTMTPGYVLTKTSVTLGVTQDTIQRFPFIIPLARKETECAAPMVELTLSTSEGGMSKEAFSFSAELLIDTGLGYCIVQAPKADVPHLVPDSDILSRGQTLTLSFNGKPFYSFTTADASDPHDPDAPDHISWRHKLHQGHGFINTSRHPLATFDYLYAIRPEGGMLRFRFLSGPKD